MLKGLEATEIKFSQLFGILDYRIESEYFLKKFLEIDVILKKNTCEPFNKCFTFLNGRAYFSEEFDTAEIQDGNKNYEIKIAKIGDVTNKRNIESWAGITTDEFQRQKGILLKYGDILMTLTGDPPDVGKVHFINISNEKCTWNQRVARIELKAHSSIISSEYAYILLSAKYCRTQIERFAKGIRQRNLGNEGLERVLVPLLPADFQSKIERIVKSAHEKLKRSKSLYAEAEEILLSELGLKGFAPQNESVSVKRFSDFAATGRLDAEYYQSKYDEIEKKISQFPTVKISEIINYPVCSGSTPKAGDSQYYTDSDNGIPFLRAVDIVQSRVDTSDLLYITPKVHAGLLRRTQLQKNDVLFSIAGTVGRCGIFDYDFEANINQAIAILRFNENVVKRLYVIQFFNSKIGKLIIEKYARQGLQTNLNLEELSNLAIPVLPMSVQEYIAGKIRESFALRSESKSLLDEAKRLVEAEIAGAGEIGV